MRALSPGLGTSPAILAPVDSRQQHRPAALSHSQQQFRMVLPRSHSTAGIRLNPSRPLPFSLHAASFTSSASGWGSSSAGGGDAKQNSSSPKGVVPKAEDCDDAIQDYDQLRSRIENLKKPPSMRGWVAVAKDFLISTGSFLAIVFKYTVAIPSYLSAFMKMSKEEWAAKKSSAWAAVKHEGHHYWVGTKLLWFDIKVASRLVMKLLRGKELTRRERSQLTRTTADIFRVVPLIIILVVPFMEFTLPVLLKVFPNMLPTTYQDKLQKEADLKRTLSVRLELAHFLQDTVAEMAKDLKKRGSGATSTTAAELYEFIKKVRAGQTVENDEILRFGQLFNDELTLDNLQRLQLVSMAHFVCISPFGTDQYLRSRLRAHLAKIKKDDYEIEKEGLENLTEDELRVAARARALRAPFGEGAVVFMQRQLRDWLDLSLHRGLPSSLLLLSRAFTITGATDVVAKKAQAYDRVRETLAGIPEEVVEGVERTALNAGDAASPEAAADREKKLAAVLTALLNLASHSGVTQERSRFMSLVRTEMDRLHEQLVVEPAPSLPAQRPQQPPPVTSLSHNSLPRFVPLPPCCSENPETPPRSLLFTGKGLTNFSPKVNKAAAAASSSSTPGSDSSSPPTSSSSPEVAAPADQLSERVSRMLHKIEKELDEVDASIGSKMHVLDTDDDGVISEAELLEAVSFLKEQLGEEDLALLFSKLGITTQKGIPTKIPISELLGLAKGVGPDGKPTEVSAIHTL
ncbi:MAG: hypothetical protein WDW38_002505 [Sanguina aurantia]